MAYDRVRPLKLEDLGTGGESDGFPKSLNNQEDAIDCRAVYLQNNTSNDFNCYIDRDSSDNMRFGDSNTSVITLDQLGTITRSTAYPSYTADYAYDIGHLWMNTTTGEMFYLYRVHNFSGTNLAWWMPIEGCDRMGVLMDEMVYSAAEGTIAATENHHWTISGATSYTAQHFRLPGGMLRLGTGATQYSSCIVYKTYGVGWNYGYLQCIRFRARLTSTADIHTLFILYYNTSNYIGFYYASNESSYMRARYARSGSTIVNTNLQTADTSWHDYELFYYGLGRWAWDIDGVQKYKYNNNTYNWQYNHAPYMKCQNQGTASRYLYIDAVKAVGIGA